MLAGTAMRNYHRKTEEQKKHMCKINLSALFTGLLLKFYFLFTHQNKLKFIPYPTDTVVPVYVNLGHEALSHFD